jgi:hypothetical protein
VLLSKPVEARKQPSVGECRFDADPKIDLGRLRENLRQPPVDVVEAGGQLIEKQSTRFRQLDPAVQTLEQRFAYQGLQLADLPADRRLRDEQLFRRAAEAQQPARSLEASQCRQGQTPALHRII